MLSYCLKHSKNRKIVKTKNRRGMVLSNCVGFGSKKSRFIKEQEDSGLFSSLGIKTPLSQVPFFGPIFLGVLTR